MTRYPILPGTGRGTIEDGGGARAVERGVDLLCPSTTLWVVPLPRWGRIA
jgi:hypothetical protein